jgi:hypothetical protein
LSATRSITDRYRVVEPIGSGGMDPASDVARLVVSELVGNQVVQAHQRVS